MGAVVLIDQANALISPIAQEIASLQPPYLSLDQFRSAFIVGVQNNPAILTYEPTSVRNALIKCATDCLLPDGRLAAIVPFKDKKQGGQQVAVYIPMIAGIVRRAAELGEVWALTVENVFEKDEWHFDRASGQPPSHIPPRLGQDRGGFNGCYAIFRDKSGGIIHVEVMDHQEVAKIRSVSRATDGPWKDWFFEMTRKTVARRGSKWVPTVSPQMRLILEREDEFVDLKKIEYGRSSSLPAQITAEVFSFDNLKPGLLNNLARALSTAETALSFKTASKTFWESNDGEFTEEEIKAIEAIENVNKERIRKDISLKEFYARLKTIIGINDTPAERSAPSASGEGEAGPDSSDHDTPSNEGREVESSTSPAEPAKAETAPKEAATKPSPEIIEPWQPGKTPMDAHQYAQYASDQIKSSTNYDALGAWLGSAAEKELRARCGVTPEGFKEIKDEAIKRGKALSKKK